MTEEIKLLTYEQKLKCYKSAIDSIKEEKSVHDLNLDNIDVLSIGICIHLTLIYCKIMSVKIGCSTVDSVIQRVFPELLAYKPEYDAPLYWWPRTNFDVRIGVIEEILTNLNPTQNDSTN